MTVRQRSFRLIPIPSSTTQQLDLVLRQAPIQEFRGDYVVTSTNSRLEGIHRSYWWGFAGRSGSDASLHELYRSSKHYSDYLVAASRDARKKLLAAHDNTNWVREKDERSDSQRLPLLPFASCVITPAGPLLPGIRRVIHTCVPRYPGTPHAESQQQQQQRLHTTLPHAWVGTHREALDLLRQCYDNVFDSILRNEEDELQPNASNWDWIPLPSFATPLPEGVSIGLPAIGCGYNGYPIEEAANIALDGIQRIGEMEQNLRQRCPYRTIRVEMRFLEARIFRIWEEQLLRRSPAHFQPME